MLTIFKPKVRQAVMKDALQSKVGLFGGDQEVSNMISESWRKDSIICSVVLTPASSKLKLKSRKKSKTKTGAKGASSKDGEAGKAGAANKSKKTKAAKVKSKKAKANSAAKTDGASAAPQTGSGESSTTAVLSNLPFVSQFNEQISEIRCEPSWPSTFHLLSAVEAVAKAGFKPEHICSALEAPIGSRLCHALDSYRIVTDDTRVLQNLESGYKIPFLFEAPTQKTSQKTPLPATDAAKQVLDYEVQGLIAKKAVKVVKPVLGQYVSSYFAVPKSKRSPDKWRPIINLKCFNHSV